MGTGKRGGEVGDLQYLVGRLFLLHIYGKSVKLCSICCAKGGEWGDILWQSGLVATEAAEGALHVETLRIGIVSASSVHV
jgi:hypothetical protein